MWGLKKNYPPYKANLMPAEGVALSYKRGPL